MYNIKTDKIYLNIHIYNNNNATFELGLAAK